MIEIKRSKRNGMERRKEDKRSENRSEDGNEVFGNIRIEWIEESKEEIMKVIGEKLEGREIWKKF